MIDLERLKQHMNLAGNICGVLGAAVCVLAVVLRLMGQGKPDFMTVKAANLFLVGVGIIVFGCWAKLTAK